MNPTRTITIVAALLGLGSFVAVLVLSPVEGARRRPVTFETTYGPPRPNTSIQQIRDALAEGRTHSALNLASLQVDHAPGNSEGWMWLAYLERVAGEPDRAEHAADHLLEMMDNRLAGLEHPTSAYTYPRAWALEVLGRQEEARQAFRRTADLYRSESRDERSPTVEYNLACYRAMAGQHEVACAHFEAWVELGGHLRQGWWASDPDLDPIREHPRYLAAVSAMVDRDGPGPGDAPPGDTMPAEPVTRGRGPSEVTENRP